MTQQSLFMLQVLITPPLIIKRLIFSHVNGTARACSMRCGSQTWNSVAVKPRLQQGMASGHFCRIAMAASLRAAAVGPGGGALGIWPDLLLPAGESFCLRDV